MLRTVLCTIVFSVAAVPISADVDCHKSYVHFLERVDQHWNGMSGDRLAILHRHALRIFDACDSGHIENPNATFWELEKGL